MTEKKDSTSEETLDEATSEETVGEKTPEKTTETIEKSKYDELETRYKGQREEGIRLKQKLDESEKAKEEEVPEDEKKFKEWQEKYDKDREEKEAQAEKAEELEFDKLEEIHGSFSRDKFKEFLNEYPAYDAKGNIDYEKSYQYFERLESAPEAPKKKTPSSQRTGDEPRKEPFDATKKSMWEIAEEAKRDISE